MNEDMNNKTQDFSGKTEEAGSKKGGENVRGQDKTQNKNDKETVDTSAKPNIIFLLRICTVLLAAVSFWSTAQGMKEYTFAEGWQAYAASLGIQGLLLGLNFSLPHFLQQSQKKLKNAPLIIFSAIVMLCSSWFSFLYIAGQGYRDSWDIKSQLMAQEAYRDQLFAADSYAERYDEELSQQMSDQILELYGKAAAMGEGKAEIVAPDWAEERTLYVTNGGAAAGEMRTVIQAMELAMGENPEQSVRQQAQDILTTQQGSFQANIASLAEQIEEAQQTVERYLTNLQNAEHRYNNRPGDADPIPYQDAMTTASNAWSRSVDRLDELQQRQQDYQDALQRINYYASLLGMAEEGVDSYFVGTNLREIQRELFQPNPDLERLMALSTDIFDRLQSAENLSEENGAEYQEFMSLMNSFINNLEKRRQMKAAKAELQQLVSELAEGNLLPVRGSIAGKADNGNPMASESAGVSGPAEDSESLEASSLPETSDSPQVSDLPEISGSPEVSGLPEASAAPDIQDDKAVDDNWAATWIAQFNELKFRISGLPTYNGDISALTENDSLLFDRGEATRELDRTVERYLTNHNAAEQGLIYLTSYYWQMAMFALVLAILLDLAAFITGIIIEREESKLAKKAKGEGNERKPWGISNAGVDEGESWPESRSLNRYLFLTGDYIYLDGVYTYKVIEKGKEGQIDLTEPGLNAGLYLWKEKRLESVWGLETQDLGQDSLEPKHVKLLYKVDTNGPRDGVYEKAQISYSDGLLSISQGEKSNFLGNVDPYTPVYRWSAEAYDVLSVKELEWLYGKTVVVELDREGIKIIALYIEAE